MAARVSSLGGLCLADRRRHYCALESVEAWRLLTQGGRSSLIPNVQTFEESGAKFIEASREAYIRAE